MGFLVTRVEVPIDDRWHPVSGGAVVLTALAGRRMLVWLQVESGEDGKPYEYAISPMRVFATNQVVPDGAFYVSSAWDPPAGAYHLYASHGPRDE